MLCRCYDAGDKPQHDRSNLRINSRPARSILPDCLPEHEDNCAAYVVKRLPIANALHGELVNGESKKTSCRKMQPGQLYWVHRSAYP